MIINVIGIDPRIYRKIYDKHNILAEEIESVLKKGKPIFKRVGGDQILVIGLYNRYLTIFFKYNSKRKQAVITTAYLSDKKQIK